MTQVVILSDVAPSTKVTAGSVLNAFVQALPRDWKVDAITVGELGLTYALEDSLADRVFFIRKPWTQWHAPKISRPLISLVEKMSLTRESDEIRNRIQKLLDTVRPDVVVTASQCPVLTAVIRKLEFQNAKVIGFMWDHPVLWADGHGIRGSAREAFISDWKTNLEKSDIRILPSNRARMLFEHPKPGSQTMTLYPFIADSIAKENKLLASQAFLRAGFAGQLYAADEMTALVHALDSANWRIHDKKVELHFFGKDRLNLSRPGIRHHGWLPADQLVKNMASMDFAVLPYPSDSRHKVISDTSFPSKLSLYAASGLPVFLIGDNEAAVSEFIKGESIGVISSKTEIPEILEQFISNLPQFESSVPICYQQNFSRDAFQGKVNNLLNESKILFSKPSELADRSRIRFGDWSTMKTAGRARVIKSKYIPKSILIVPLLSPLLVVKGVTSRFKNASIWKVSSRSLTQTIPRLGIAVLFKLAARGRSQNSTSMKPTKQFDKAEFDWSNG
jgi:hypothetical protein